MHLFRGKKEKESGRAMFYRCRVTDIPFTRWLMHLTCELENVRDISRASMAVEM